MTSLRTALPLKGVESSRIELLRAHPSRMHRSSTGVAAIFLVVALGVGFGTSARAWGDGTGWSRQFGTPGADEAQGVALDRANFVMGREIKFDPKAEVVVGDPEAARLLTREYRKPFVVPESV